MARLARITQAEAARGIYFDYEGNADAAPAILGWGYENAVASRDRSIPLSRRWRSFENPKHDVQRASLDEALVEMAAIAKRERPHGLRFRPGRRGEPRAAVYCTEQTGAVEWIDQHYVNSKPYIDRWVRHLVQSGDIQEPTDKSLLTSMPLVGMDYTPSRGPGIVGPGLTRLRSQLARYGEADLINEAERRGTGGGLIGHNASDVLATQQLTVAVTVAHLYGQKQV